MRMPSPVTGVDGQGCGDSGKRGSRDGAVSNLMRNAFAMISGTAYREAKSAAPQAQGSGVAQSLPELQKLRDDGVITQPEFEKLKAKIISAP